MFADGDRASSERSSPARGFDLQRLSSDYHRVIPAHHPLLLYRKQNIQILPLAPQKRAARLQSRHLESLIELGHVLSLEKNIGLLQRANTAQTQLLRQASLPSSKAPLRTPPRLRRVGRYHPNPQFLQSPSHLRQPFQIHLPTRSRRPKEVTGAVAVQGAENPFLLDHLSQCPPPRHRPFLFHQLRVVNPAGRIVQNHQQE